MFTTKPAPLPTVLVPLSCMNVLMPGLSDILVGLHKASLKGSFRYATSADQLGIKRGGYNLHLAMSSNGQHIQISYGDLQNSPEAKSEVLWPISTINVHGGIFDGGHYRIEDVAVNGDKSSPGIIAIDSLFPSQQPIKDAPLQDRLILALLTFAAIQKTHKHEGKNLRGHFQEYLQTIADNVCNVLLSYGISTYADGLFYRAEHEEKPFLILYPEFVKQLATLIDPESMGSDGKLQADAPIQLKNIRPALPPAIQESRAEGIFRLPAP